MNFKDYMQLKTASISPQEELVYEFIAHEIESGDVRKGLWTKALSETGWDEQKAKAIYVKMRFKSLEPEVIAYLQSIAKKSKAQVEQEEHFRCGLSEEDAEYLGKPILAHKYEAKYGLSQQKIQAMIERGKLKAVLVAGVLWTQDKRVK